LVRTGVVSGRVAWSTFSLNAADQRGQFIKQLVEPARSRHLEADRPKTALFPSEAARQNCALIPVVHRNIGPTQKQLLTGLLRIETLHSNVHRLAFGEFVGLARIMQ
jgi:hypothetical protein